jgi:hypothetical protein
VAVARKSNSITIKNKDKKKRKKKEIRSGMNKAGSWIMQGHRKAEQWQGRRGQWRADEGSGN